METFTAIDGTMYAIGSADADTGPGTRIEKGSARDYAVWLSRAFNRYFDDYRQRWARLGGEPGGRESARQQETIEVRRTRAARACAAVSTALSG